MQAQTDLAAANVATSTLGGAIDLTEKDLGGMVLQPRVYKFDAAAGLAGSVTLDNSGDPNAMFVFQIGSALTTVSGSSVVLASGLNAGNVYWVVGSSATLGAGTASSGSILAFTSITLDAGSTILSGRALALNGAVTLDTNRIGVPVSEVTAAPESATWRLMILGFGAIGCALRGRQRGCMEV